MKNEIGNRYGKLVVLSRGENDNNGKARWYCQCDCGNTKIVLADNLKRGLTQSCGCLHSECTHNATFIDITNQKFGKLTAESYYKCALGGFVID